DHAATELFAEELEADDHVGVDDLGAGLLAGAAVADAGGAVPGQELGVALDIGDEGIHLLGGPGDAAGVGVLGQVVAPAAAAGLTAGGAKIKPRAAEGRRRS